MQTMQINSFAQKIMQTLWWKKFELS